jgi:hypothetical protein
VDSSRRATTDIAWNVASLSSQLKSQDNENSRGIREVRAARGYDRLLLARGIHRYQCGRNQVNVNTHAEGFLHLAAMTCPEQDIIVSGLRAR